MANRDLGIVACVPDRWSGYWQVRHQILSRLARHVPVVWMDPAPGPGAISLRRSIEQSKQSGLWVSRPNSTDHALRRSIRRYRARYRQRVAEGMAFLRSQGCQRVGLYIWRPEYATVVELPGVDSVVYHIDDDYSFSETPSPPNEQEARLLRRADTTIIHSNRLFEKKASYAKRAVRIPNGVDFESYFQPSECPKDMRDIPRPIVGYSGFLKLQVDWELVLSLSQAMSDVSFVFVGPKRSQPELDAALAPLEARPNVFFLGGRPHGSLPAYVKQFDVAVMPYRVNNYTNCIYPLKMHEYMAAGVPIVSSQIDAVREFDEIVASATSSDQWQGAVQQLISDNTESARATRLGVAKAREYDWDNIAERVADVLMSPTEAESVV